MYDTFIINKFWDRVDKIDDATSCWNWLGGKNGKYGQFSIGNRKNIFAHRFSAGLSTNVQGKVVCHHCDNPLCVRPDHLFVGTHADNMRDMALKNRAYRPQGTLNVSNKLSDLDVLEIKTKSLTAKQYATKYNISTWSVYDIWAGKTWAWL